jgi:hypothetical protein
MESRCVVCDKVTAGGNYCSIKCKNKDLAATNNHIDVLGRPSDLAQGLVGLYSLQINKLESDVAKHVLRCDKLLDDLDKVREENRELKLQVAIADRQNELQLEKKELELERGYKKSLGGIAETVVNNDGVQKLLLGIAERLSDKLIDNDNEVIEMTPEIQLLLDVVGAWPESAVKKLLFIVGLCQDSPNFINSLYSELTNHKNDHTNNN